MPYGKWALYFYAVAGFVQAVHGRASLGGVAQTVGSEVAGLFVGALEVHGEELPHGYGVEEAACARRAVFALTGVDGEESHVERRMGLGYSVEFHYEHFGGAVCLALGVLLVPVPVVEVPGVEDSGAVGHGHAIAHALVGRAVGLHLDTFGQTFNGIAGTHPVDGHVVVDFARGNVVRKDIEAPVALAEVEDIGVEVVGMVVCHEENHRLVGTVAERFLHHVRRVAVIVEHKDDFRIFHHKTGIVEESNCRFHNY